MPSSAILNKIRANAQYADNVITDLKEELELMKNEIIHRTVRDLEIENKRLQDEIDSTKQKLIHLENIRGVKQVQLPLKKNLASINSNNSVPVKKEIAKKESVDDSNKILKLKKTDVPEPTINVGRLDMRIGQIKEVEKHPDADSLYVSKVDCGEPNLRTVVSGLVKFVPKEEMNGRMVVLLCNLKPAKMRGVLSEAMVMCASTPDKVEILIPPVSSLPGDLVYCEGYLRNPDIQLNPKKKIFEICAPDLKTNSNFVACYKNSPLHVPNKGNIVSSTLAEVQVK